ncbi:MAG: hypothetical protein M0Q94_10895 [Candidatus Cloacimonetes bacterium]|nr:hypothetical protein [Candidatus Cloacimonadota bacterium]
MNNKIKVGYLPLYIKLYDDSNPHERDSMVDYMEMLIRMLESQGLEIVRTDEICRIKPEFDRAAEKFNNADVDAVITQNLAYSPSLESIKAILSLKAPIVVFDTTPDYRLSKVQQYYDGISPNHGIHGVQDLTNMLKQNGKPYYLCVGHALHSNVVSEVVSMCRAAAAAKFFKKETVGSVGGSFTGMGDFLVSEEHYKKAIGPEVKYMTPEVVKKFIAQVSEKEIDAEIASDRQKYDVQVNDEKSYRASTKSGLAIRKWMEAEKIDSCTVNFLTLDKCGLPKMPFVECCKILGTRHGYAGEGDVLTAGLVGALMSIYPETSFTEMFCPDWEEDLILLSHMGESNPNLSQWKPLVTDTKFNYNSCGDTTAMYNCYRPGNVVYVNLAPMGDRFSMIITEAKIVDAGLRNGVYGKATQGWLKPCKPIREFLKEYSEAGGTHHSAMVYNGNAEEIKAFGKMLGFDIVEIK